MSYLCIHVQTYNRQTLKEGTLSLLFNPLGGAILAQFSFGNRKFRMNDDSVQESINLAGGVDRAQTHAESLIKLSLEALNKERGCQEFGNL